MAANDSNNEKKPEDIIIGITENRQADEALRLAQFAMDRAPFSIVWVNDQGDMVYVNDMACSSLGYSREELLNMKVFDIDPDFPPEGWQKHMDDLRRTRVMNFESRHITKDGRLFPVEVTTNYFEYKGRFYGFAFDRDISERRDAENALKLSEATYREIFNTVNDAIYIHDIDTGAIIDVNTSMLEMFGYTLEEARSLTFKDISSGIPPYTEETAIEFMKKTAAGKPRIFEWHCRHKDGRLFWTEVSLKLGTIAGKERILAIERDITDRKLVESELSESQRIYATLIENLPGFSFRCRNDEQWTMVFISSGCLSVTGYSSEDLIKNNIIAYAELIHPDWRQPLWEKFQESLNRNDPFEMEYPIINSEGEIRWVWERSRGIYDINDKVLFIEGFITDITQRKMDEEESEKLQAQLAQAQKLESVGRLAGGVAHDFNNMLGVILGYTELILEGGGESDPHYSSLMEIHRAASRSADLTRQLLAFARKQTVAPLILDLNETVEGMLNMLRRLIGEDIQLQWKPGSDTKPVMIDPSQIDQILANLCVNARDAITGTGKITIETGSAVFDEEYCAENAGFLPGEYALLAVSDDGCGMDEETITCLFEPFFTTKKTGEGTGLGLSTVYGIIKQNNGFINVYSEPDQGTIFRIYLPLYKSGPYRRTRTEPAKKPASGHETILLVEDEPAILNITGNMIERLGYTVLSAGFPGAAIQLARSYPHDIHLLITDVIMPEMNGRQLAGNILKLYPYLKRLFMSGYTANVIAHHGVLDEGVHFIQKPFSIHDLSVKIREALEN